MRLKSAKMREARPQETLSIIEKAEVLHPGTLLVGFHVEINKGKWENPVWGTKSYPKKIFKR